MSTTFRIYHSKRGIPLVYVEAPARKPSITVENFKEWASLIVVDPQGNVHEFNDNPNWVAASEAVIRKFQFDKAGTHKAQDAFNPNYVQFLAKELDFYIPWESLEIIIGRWEIQYNNNYRTIFSPKDEVVQKAAEGFNEMEKAVLNNLYAVNKIDATDIAAKIRFLILRDPDGPSSVHYNGMGHDDEKTQQESELRIREYKYLMDCGQVE